MLEGAVARLLNHLLGKYVVDLDTENLNVGIFSGQVQLTDLKLKTEALYELNLPVEVKVGTIGKLWLQIPWTCLWSQPIVINIEDLHIIFGPILMNTFDPDKNKRLIRASKRKILSDLSDKQTNDGPILFLDQLLTNILNNIQFIVNNVHIRYEDSVSCKKPLAAGLCIASITAETTNNKWKATKYDKNALICYYLIKVEALSLYWDYNVELKSWNLPSQYYMWRNSMSNSLKNYKIDKENFKFIIRPMTTKVKITVNKSDLVKCSVDVIIQDSHIQMNKEQYESILNVNNSLSRMWISWNFLNIRPSVRVLEDRKIWWRYSFLAVLEQKIRPYYWEKVKFVRQQFKLYVETFKKVISNPNDTELKLDLQKYEDNLNIVNIVIAREQARLLTQSMCNANEKTFWSILQLPERNLLCEKLQFNNQKINQKITVRIGNISFSLFNNSTEVLICTMTQTNFTFEPIFLENTYKATLKIEGLIIEGVGSEEQFIPIVVSEHSGSSPAYFFQLQLEKVSIGHQFKYKFFLFLDSLECFYNKQSLEYLLKFADNEYFSYFSSDEIMQKRQQILQLISNKILDNWSFNLDFKIPYLVIPEFGNISKAQSVLIIDMGRYMVTTEIPETVENPTKMELEEQLYSKLNIKATNLQILFCNNCDNWKDAKKEKDTDLHLLSSTTFSAIYAMTDSKEISTRCKLNITFQSIKINMSERRLLQLLKFLQSEILLNWNKHNVKKSIFSTDKIIEKLTLKQLLSIENKVKVNNTCVKVAKNKTIPKSLKKTNSIQVNPKDINEAWARNLDLPGLEDNISSTNKIIFLLRFVVNEFSVNFLRASDSADLNYLMCRMGLLTMDLAHMNYGPAYQISLNSIILTDKLHTNSSGQYIDLIYTPFPSTLDVVTILYRKVSADCPDFWRNFHGVETSLVVDIGSINLLLHQDSLYTAVKYYKYMQTKIRKYVYFKFHKNFTNITEWISRKLHVKNPVPVPAGSIKFSNSARLGNANIRICDSDFDILNINLSELEMDFLFRANERFVFRSYLSILNIEHLSETTLYSKVLSTNEDKVFELKYVKQAAHIKDFYGISPNDSDGAGNFKLYLGQIHITLLYKLIVQLKRFLANLDALKFINELLSWWLKQIAEVTDTLRNNEKINLAITVCGPVILLPQKSSSPNVMVIDTGEFLVENFFKQYSNNVVENILIKWNGLKIKRAVMTLTSSLEMQEAILEPFSLNLDIKRYTNPKNCLKVWDIDGILDPVHITLGQRDISIILLTYTENIGEGKIQDLFYEENKSSTTKDDETVKILEAFFCELKQKKVICKVSLEEITLWFYLDSTEVLSSPIRDINHGLCNFIIKEINTSFIIYTDKSLEGKLSLDSVLIKEIGPDAKMHNKGILQSPIEDNKNNNYYVTVNNPPIIDVTFFQNTSEDLSIDVIVGKLCLNLSVPFCEKIALFVLECIPKDNFDNGFINHGYESDQIMEELQDKSMSLTVSVRINKPECIFDIDSTSNKKRYFKTHAEVLIDYSKHNNGLNFIVSFSDLYTLFHDVGLHNVNEDYTVLKQCDLEFSKCYSKEKGIKIILSVSSIYVQICSNVVHSITDILNDIVEHFEVPEKEFDKQKKIGKDLEELWEPKKLSEFHQSETESVKCENKSDIHEILLIPKFDLIVIFELYEIQAILVKATMEITVYNWSSMLNCTSEITIQANYFNENLQIWEPFLDPIVLDENIYKPWYLLVKIFQDKSMLMMEPTQNRLRKTVKKTKTKTSMSEEESDGGDMLYLKPLNNTSKINNPRIKTNLSTFLDDSDSEIEDGTMEKLSAAISDLFTGDWNESEKSDSINSSEDDDSENNLNQECETLVEDFRKSTYILIEAKEVLNFTVTPQLLKLINEIFTTYLSKTLSIIDNKKSINLINDIGPQAKIELYEKIIDGTNEKDLLICEKTYENQDSPINTKITNFFDNLKEINDDKDGNEDHFKVNKEVNTILSLQFPTKTKSELYDQINRNFIKLYLPDYQTIQTSCSRNKWQKLIKLHSIGSGQNYYLAAKHIIEKFGKNTYVFSSPLQIKNETCFALSVLYQPSILQELNLEPIGHVINPFETTMRIVILESHDQYNVPLYIAYHCKLFIQPAYAEGNYTSDCGMWWKDMASELGLAHNLNCFPKSNSNLETFSLRVILKKNLELQNPKIHSIPNFVIHLLPPLILLNFLPYSLEVENTNLRQLIKVEPGEKKCVYSLDLSKDQKLLIKIKYNLINWSGFLNITTHLDEKIVVLNNDNKDEIENNLKQLFINIKTDNEGSFQIYFYTPYWIINKTCLPLQMKVSETNVIYENKNDNILLFTYKRHEKQMLNVRVYESNWSNEFALDCAGTTGLVICKDNERNKKYMFFIKTELSNMCPRFTKIVLFLPGFLIANATNRNLRFMEHNEKTDLWTDLVPNQVLTFWPETSSMQMYVKYEGSKVISQAFSIVTNNTTVLRMDKGSALTVSVTGGVYGSFNIQFTNYKYGDAPVLIENYCADLFLKIQQYDQSQVTLLSPFNYLLYTWDDPTKIRKLTWNVYNNKKTGFQIDINKNGHGEERVFFHSVLTSEESSTDSDSLDSVKITLKNKVRRDKMVIYWVCYKKTSQRFLLFTQDIRIFNSVINRHFNQYCTVEALISLSGLGISIFASENSGKESIYVLFGDSPAIWEVNVGKKWKILTLELASWIEDKYKLHYKKCHLKDYIQIDFEKMYMIKPFLAELRRTYIPAIYFQFRNTKIQQDFNLKIKNVQIDNKMNNTVILQPFTTNTANSMKELNPFIDFSISKISTKEFSVFKNITLKIHNFQINIESDLIVEFCELFSKNKKFRQESALGYISDMKLIQNFNTIMDKNSPTIEYLCVNNFEVLVNISNKIQIGLNRKNISINRLLNCLFPSNISPYIPIEGICHRIPSMEEINSTCKFSSAIKNIYSHVTSQFLQQYYSQVLGLQVLLNPFALHPSSNKPTEVDAEKMSYLVLYGCRCLLSHINMSPVALEQCIIDIFATQTIENIQRIRRYGSYQKFESISKVVAVSSKSLNCGVPNALSQLIVKQHGVNCNGETFSKTTGKALFSIMARHADEKTDLVEIAKEALKRAVILGEPIRIQQRLTRYSNSFLGLKPFSNYESIGHNLLETVGNSRFFTDRYWSHASIDKSGKSIILITLEHVIKINKNRLWGPWEVEWVVNLDDIISMPKITSTELTFNIRQNEELKLVGENEMLIWIHEKTEQAIIVSMDGKSWGISE